MEVIAWGTRGSLPVANPGMVQTGGNTTCFEVRSICLPPGVHVVIDGGTGFLPFANEALRLGMTELHLFHTHYHHDHTQGVLIAPPIFMQQMAMHIYGTKDRSYGPKQVYERIMEPPFHPVSFGAISQHISFHQIEIPPTRVILIHPEGGQVILEKERFVHSDEHKRPVSFGQGRTFPIDECLVVQMHWTEHPERTITYRFEERPTGRVFVLLTDEEVRAGIPVSLIEFISGTHLLIQDVQYSQEEYEKGGKAGFGHGTPEYAVRLARATGVNRIGFTHHDPLSADGRVGALVTEGQALLQPDETLALFSCRDYDRYEV
ncbi:MBL fold metallo-hydrolase [Armatimonas rosea]|uniref:Phosphoribosyl 1,2-cyclic phosphodiesterase n=1 Tax=Armatimonas rosea TaxID=685828 RepID=A0A7W9W7B1_ARMRO|nr:MBL fold metallo-hydrolase [Armatimonas rosea]MBB6052279.1 phosphoribosyl 1,2-cyclic phosphodiesterase [Armatimonas rosea]